MGRLITSPGLLKNVQGQINDINALYQEIKDNNLKPLTITLDPVTNANGSVSVVTEDERVTEDMKAIAIEVGTPEVFKAPISVTTASGEVTLTCDNATGTSTVAVTFIKTSPVSGGEDYPPAITSTEFDILADRIGALSTLETSDKTDVVSAVNEVLDDVNTLNSKIDNVEYDTDTSIWTPTTSGRLTIDEVKVNKCNRMVNWMVKFTATVTHTGQPGLFTIPEKYRQRDNINLAITGVRINSSGEANGTLPCRILGSLGQSVEGDAITAGETYVISACYIGKIMT